jgi:hypothetical protein
LQPAILVPGALNARAMSHAIFAQQSSGFIPLAADTVQQAILIAFFVSQHTVFVPDADNAMPATVAQWHHFTKLPITVESFINGLLQYAFSHFIQQQP